MVWVCSWVWLSHCLSVWVIPLLHLSLRHQNAFFRPGDAALSSIGEGGTEPVLISSTTYSGSGGAHLSCKHPEAEARGAEEFEANLRPYLPDTLSQNKSKIIFKPWDARFISVVLVVCKHASAKNRVCALWCNATWQAVWCVLGYQVDPNFENGVTW